MAAPSHEVLFGRYQIERELAVGGMGELYLTRDRRLDRWVVIKHLRHEKQREERYINMFLEEARALARIDHPHITRIFDVGVADGRHFMALEWIRGWDLTHVQRRLSEGRAQLPLPIALQLMLDACAGLHAAHQATTTDGTPLNLVHRDINPNNLMVTDDGVLKVVDFGVAKTSVQAELTAAGQIKGTPQYFSPEQCRGQPLDRRSDLFSLGVVLHELLTGEMLFDRPEPAASALAIIDLPIQSPVRPGAPLPERLVAITMRALQRDREQRFADAEALASELRAVLTAFGAPTRGDIARYVATLFPQGPATPVKDVATAYSEQPTVRLNVAVDEQTVPAKRSADRSDEATALDRPAAPSTPQFEVPARPRWRAGHVVAGVLLLAVVGAAVAYWSHQPQSVSPRAGPAVLAAITILDASAAVARAAADATVAAPTGAVAVTSVDAARVAPVADAGSKRPTSAGRRRTVDAIHRPAATTATAKPGWLTLESEPWAYVEIDGKRVGPTPLLELPLPAGRVRLRLVNDELGLQRELELVIPAGRILRKAVRLER